MSSKRTHVLVVGGGFGGVRTALELSKEDRVEVTLISDHSHFRYYPALYRTATGGKRAGARLRLDNILHGSAVRFVRARATKLNREEKYIQTADGEKHYFDVLVLALGSVTNYFGIPGLPEYAYGIKSTEDAERFRAHLHQQLTDANRPDLNYFIVGGGPTGIELAGELPGYLKQIMKKHGVKDRKLHISLIEAAPRLLPRSPKKLSRMVAKRLRKLGIKIYLNTAVKGQDADSLMFGDKDLPSTTVVWTAGVANNPFFKANNFNLNERGKVVVNEYLEAEPDIYVLGDNAATQYSGMAQTALYDGDCVAHTIICKLEGKQPKPYVPKQPISVIPVGPYWASVEWGKYAFGGFIGWLLHHAALLRGFGDLESWPKAGGQWLKTIPNEEYDCPKCSGKYRKATLSTAR